MCIHAVMTRLNDDMTAPSSFFFLIAFALHFKRSRNGDADDDHRCRREAGVFSALEAAHLFFYFFSARAAADADRGGRGHHGLYIASWSIYNIMVYI